MNFPDSASAFRLLARKLLHRTPFQITRWLPPVSLEPLRLVMDALAHSTANPVLVQVGAYDGISNDPVHGYVRGGRFRSLLIEPIPRTFARLQRTYADVPGVTLLQAAVSDHDGELTMYCAQAPTALNDPDDHAQLASFYRSVLLKHDIPPEQIEEIRVPVRSLASLSTEYQLGRISFLQIDAEGHDTEIVLSALQLEHLPDCINFEHIQLTRAQRETIFHALAARGYSWIHDSMNSLAIHPTALHQLTSSA